MGEEKQWDINKISSVIVASAKTGSQNRPFQTGSSYRR